MTYNEYKFIFPPRISTATPPQVLNDKDRFKGYIAQPKLNGDCMLIFTDGVEMMIRHRDGELFKKPIKMSEKLRDLTKVVTPGHWMVLVGEHMIKNKKGSEGKTFNEKFVIHDILVWNSKWLVGSTYAGRVMLLDNIFGCVISLHEKYLFTTQYTDIFRVRSYMNDEDFLSLFKQMIKVDMIEGLYLKKAKEELQPGRREKNNEMGLCKIRKPTPGYIF